MSQNFERTVVQISSGEDVSCNLRASSFILCLLGLSEMECRHRWRHDDKVSPITDEEWDTIEGWVSGAYVDLLTTVVEENAVLGIDEFTQEQASGTTGNTYNTAMAVQPVVFNTDNSENAGNVTRVSSVLFEALPGLYWVEIDVSQHSCGIGRVGLFEDNGDEHALIGVNHSDETRHASGLVRVPEDNSFYVWFLGAETGTIGRLITQAGVVERYARIVWTKIGD